MSYCKHKDSVLERKKDLVSKSCSVTTVDDLNDDEAERLDVLDDRMLVSDSSDVISVVSVDSCDLDDVIRRDTSWCTTEPIDESYLTFEGLSKSRRFLDVTTCDMSNEGDFLIFTFEFHDDAVFECARMLKAMNVGFLFELRFQVSESISDSKFQTARSCVCLKVCCACLCLLVEAGFAYQRNADDTVLVIRSAADGSRSSCDEKKLQFIVWERGAHSSAVSNTI